MCSDNEVCFLRLEIWESLGHHEGGKDWNLYGVTFSDFLVGQVAGRVRGPEVAGEGFGADPEVAAAYWEPAALSTDPKSSGITKLEARASFSGMLWYDVVGYIEKKLLFKSLLRSINLLINFLKNLNKHLSSR